MPAYGTPTPSWHPAVQELLEQNAGPFRSQQRDIFAYSRSSTVPALRYFNTSQFEISWYFDTEMPVQHWHPKSKIANDYI
jgi:hypothetical protein